MPFGIIILLMLAGLSFMLGLGYILYEIKVGKLFTRLSGILMCSYPSIGCAALFAYLTWKGRVDDDPTADLYRVLYDFSFAITTSVYIIFLYIRSALIFKESPYRLLFIRVASVAAIFFAFVPHLLLLIFQRVSPELYEAYFIVILRPAFIGGIIIVGLDIFYCVHFRNLIISKRTNDKMRLISKYGLYCCLLSLAEFLYLTIIFFCPMELELYYQLYSGVVAFMLSNTIVITILKLKLEVEPVKEKTMPETKFKTALKSADLKTMNY